MSDPLAALIGRHEGLRLYVYDDATGKPFRRGDTLRGNLTIGYGWNLSVNGITVQDAERWRDQMIDELRGRLAGQFPWFPTLLPSRQGVLIDIAYNAGLGGVMQFKRMLAALEEGDYGKASEEILDSQLAPARKAELARIMKKGEWA